MAKDQVMILLSAEKLERYINEANELLAFSETIIEKDYWVCWVEGGTEMVPEEVLFREERAYESRCRQPFLCTSST